MKEATKEIDVHRELFNIPPYYPTRHRGLIPLKYFRNVDATPFVYDRFIGAWGQFPHHDQVSIYFSKHLYANFVLHMRLDYTDTISRYYGPSFGRTYERNGAYRDPGHVPPPLRLLPLLSWSLVLPTKLKELLQLSGETRETIADNMRISLASTCVALDGDIRRPPPFPDESPVPLYDDAFLTSLPFDQLLTYTCMYRDVICETLRAHDRRDTG